MAKSGSDPSFSGTEATQGVDANPTVPKWGWGRGLFAWENGIIKKSWSAGAAAKWGSKGLGERMLFNFRNVTESRMSHNYNGRHFQPGA